jgi:hypothetical protein
MVFFCLGVSSDFISCVLLLLLRLKRRQVKGARAPCHAMANGVAVA